MCKYFINFLLLVTLIKQLNTTDHDGNCTLHVGVVQASMAILHEFDPINFLRYASWYPERIQVLEVTHPTLYRQICMGYLVKDRVNAVFDNVSGDLKLEQF